MLLQTFSSMLANGSLRQHHERLGARKKRSACRGRMRSVMGHQLRMHICLRNIEHSSRNASTEVIVRFDCPFLVANERFGLLAKSDLMFRCWCPSLPQTQQAPFEYYMSYRDTQSSRLMSPTSILWMSSNQTSKPPRKPSNLNLASSAR
jgi:hypothetical protein